MNEKIDPELDLAVANAVGLKVVTGGVDEDGEFKLTGLYADDVWVVYGDGDESRLFRPSTDLNAAFAAAEKARLFCDEETFMQQVDTQWRVCRWQHDEGPPKVDTAVDLGCASVPALAICAAILKLKESKRWQYQNTGD